MSFLYLISMNSGSDLLNFKLLVFVTVIVLKTTLYPFLRIKIRPNFVKVKFQKDIQVILVWNIFSLYNK